MHRDLMRGKVMLGFSSSKGVEIKGRFAEEMHATMKRVRSGRLNKADKAAGLAFPAGKGKYCAGS